MSAMIVENVIYYFSLFRKNNELEKLKCTKHDSFLLDRIDCSEAIADLHFLFNFFRPMTISFRNNNRYSIEDRRMIGMKFNLQKWFSIITTSVGKTIYSTILIILIITQTYTLSVRMSPLRHLHSYYFCNGE